jgi:osmotically-inducible protein OsmY
MDATNEDTTVQEQPGASAARELKAAARDMLRMGSQWAHNALNWVDERRNTMSNRHREDRDYQERQFAQGRRPETSSYDQQGRAWPAQGSETPDRDVQGRYSSADRAPGYGSSQQRSSMSQGSMSQDRGARDYASQGYGSQGDASRYGSQGYGSGFESQNFRPQEYGAPSGGAGAQGFGPEGYGMPGYERSDYYGAQGYEQGYERQGRWSQPGSPYGSRSSQQGYPYQGERGSQQDEGNRQYASQRMESPRYPYSESLQHTQYGGYEPSQRWGSGQWHAPNAGERYGQAGTRGEQSYGELQGYGQQGMRTSHRGLGPKNYSRSDERIREDINERLTDADDIDARGLTVEVSNGIATLTGTVEQRWMKHRAEDLAESCSGVRDVHNQIRVQSRDAGMSSQPGRSTSASSGSLGAGGSSAMGSSTSMPGSGKSSASTGGGSGLSGSTGSAGGASTSGTTPTPTGSTRPSNS